MVYGCLRVLIAREFVIHLLGMSGMLLDFFLASTAQDGANGVDNLHYHVVHDVVALHEEVDIVGGETQLSEFVFQCLEFS